jgi:hypothetical protein
MRAARLIAAALALFWSASAFADPQFPTPWPNVNAPGAVIMCPNGQGTYSPCGGAGALPLSAAIANIPSIVPQQPTVYTAIATGTTGAVTATLAAVHGETMSICGVDVSGIGGTAEASPITITGLKGGTFTYQLPVLATGGQLLLSRTFTPCIPANAANQAIAVVTTAAAGASAVDVQAWGVAQ